MRKHTAFLLAGAATLALSPVGATSQAPSQPQLTFRSATNLVEVDVVVQDRDGRFVPGLTADDLVVFEDGEPQQIQQFYLVNNATGDLTLLPAPDSAGGHSQRLFVFVFDLAHLGTESLLRTKTGVERFINTQFRRGDFGGVFHNGAMHLSRVTEDKIQLLAGVRQIQPAFDNRERLLQSFRDFPQIPAESDALRIDYGDQRLVDNLAAGLCSQGSATFEDCRAAGGVDQVEVKLDQKARQYVREARNNAGNTIDSLRLVAANLATIPGRKTVIFLSDGFMIDETRDELRQIAALAARGGTAIYSIYGRGSAVVNGRAMPDAVSSRPGLDSTFDTTDDGPQILTAGTGGFVVRNINDISRAVSIVARDTSTYYVLGYSPKRQIMDGKVRRIEVKARAQDLNVRARNSYLASPLPPRQPLRNSGSGFDFSRQR